MTDPATEDTLRWILPIFTRRRDDGSLFYSDDAVRAFIPVFLLSVGFDPAKAPPHLAAQVGALARSAGVTESDDKTAAEAKLRAHLEANPIDPELVFEVNRGLREEMAGYSPEEIARDVAAALGIARPSLAPKDAPPPEGSVRSGPLARFSLAPEPPKPKPKKRRR